jgi:hypothetical protein
MIRLSFPNHRAEIQPQDQNLVTPTEFKKYLGNKTPKNVPNIKDLIPMKGPTVLSENIDLPTITLTIPTKHLTPVSLKKIQLNGKWQCFIIFST